MGTVTDSRDALLQELVPTIMVPKYGVLQPLESAGRRFLAASDGLWLEVKTDWLHLTWPLAKQNKVAMPYGTLEKKAEFLYGAFPVHLVREFLGYARETFPNECAAWFIWDSAQREFMYRPLRAIRTGVGHLKYERPNLSSNESLVCDMHSHGPEHAYFSRTDDRDDCGETKISGVVGEIGGEGAPSACFRLCAAGITLPLNFNFKNILDLEVLLYV